MSAGEGGTSSALARLLALALTLLASGAAPARAQIIAPPPYAEELRAHYYERLAKSPWRALGFELLCPGAGNLYVGLHVPAIATLSLSLAGASLWLAGAVRDERRLELVGIGTLAASRAYGVVSAPVGALLLNAAFRRQLGISARF